MPGIILFQCFGRAIEVEPESGHSKYMYMGQLLTGQDALNCFEKGIQIMKKCIEDLQGAEVIKLKSLTPTLNEMVHVYGFLCNITGRRSSS